MQYQVPQFIDTEDKIVGPFSLRQFAYVGAAGVVCAICYFFLQTWLFVIITALVLGSAIALAFVKINGRPLVNIAISAFNFYWKPQMYVWKAQHPIVQQPKPAAPITHSLPPTIKPEPVKPEPVKPAPRELPTIKKIAEGDSLHKSWENLQTGTAHKTSDRQFLEKKMAERYQIFQRLAGDRAAARRVDYR